MLQLSMIRFTAGSYILMEGNPPNDRIYIIRQGQVRCSKKNDKADGSVPTILGPGDFIGVIPCMSDHTQIETVVAITDTVCISVKREQYPDLIMSNVAVALKVIKAFSKQMRDLNSRLALISLKNDISASAEHLFETADYYEQSGKMNCAFFCYYHYLKACPDGNNFEMAKKKFTRLRPHVLPAEKLYLEPTADLLKTYEKDTLIMAECQSGSEMYIIQDGEVHITKVVDDKEVTLAMLKKGDMFGEMALLENKPRSANAVAHTDCKLMTVNRANFDKMVMSQPQLVARLTTTLADRIWSMNRQLTNALIQDPYHKMLDMLALQLEKTHNTSDRMYTTPFTIMDLAAMCAINSSQVKTCLASIKTDTKIKLNAENKIVVSNCNAIIKFAVMFRDQLNAKK